MSDMLRTIIFVTGVGMTLGSFASFHRIDDPFTGIGPSQAFISLFWFILGTVIAVFAARRVLTGIAKLAASWFEASDGTDFVTLWLECRKAELRARTAEALAKAREE